MGVGSQLSPSSSSVTKHQGCGQSPSTLGTTAALIFWPADFEEGLQRLLQSLSKRFCFSWRVGSAAGSRTEQYRAVEGHRVSHDLLLSFRQTKQSTYEGINGFPILWTRSIKSIGERQSLSTIFFGEVLQDGEWEGIDVLFVDDLSLSADLSAAHVGEMLKQGTVGYQMQNRNEQCAVTMDTSRVSEVIF